MADFATRLRDLRKAGGLRQADLAAALGLAQTTVANYEQHNRFPDEETLGKIADYFDVSLDYLFGRSEFELLPQRILEYRRQDTPGPESLTPEAKEYLAKILGGRDEEAFAFVTSMVGNDMTVQQVYRSILEPTLKEIGRLWETNEIDVSREHYVSRATETLMGRLKPLVVRKKRAEGTIIFVAVGGELHDIGLRMVSDFLEAEGYRCVFLGSNTPTAGILSAIIEWNAQILGISATLSFNVDAVANMIRSLRSDLRKSARREMRIVTGGQAFNLDGKLWKRVDSDGYAANADDAVPLIEGLLACEAKRRPTA